MGHDKSLDKKSILETMQLWLKAPEDDDPEKIEKYNKAKETLEDLDSIPPVPGHRGFNKAMDDNPLSSEFNKAMDAANPDGKHKKINWSNSPKKTVDRRINSIIDEIEEEEINIDLEGIQKRYIFIKGIPVPSKVEDLYIWLKVSHKENVYFYDEALKESIVIEFEEDGNEFPLELKIELWYKGYPDVKFERIGIFPADESIKRVSTDLSVRGREVKGVTAGSQESIKKFLKRTEQEKEEEAKREAVLNGMAGVGNYPPLTSAMPSSSLGSGSGMWSASSVNISATAIGGITSAGLEDSILTDESDLTQNMEEAVEKMVKASINDLRSEILGILEDDKEDLE